MGHALLKERDFSIIFCFYKYNTFSQLYGYFLSLEGWLYLFILKTKRQDDYI